MELFTFEYTSGVVPSLMKLELVERKGLGHPDTLADAIAEETSRQYVKYCRDSFGNIAHHWFDKVMLIGGESNTDFLMGHVIRPIRAILVGKAVLCVEKADIPLEDIFKHSVATVFERTLKNFSFDNYCTCEIAVSNNVGPGQKSKRYRPTSIKEIAEYESRQLVSNDCNLCVGFAPYTETEQLSFAIENFLLSAEQQRIRPWIGSDIKTVITRLGEKMIVVANIPMLASYVENYTSYKNMRKSLEDDIQSYCKELLSTSSCEVNVNPEWIHGRAYLTATGTCLDTGDIGVVGRGNRHSGLITPMRSMSIEAVAGKNPLDHTGKLFNIAATRIAEAIYKEFELPVTVYIVTKKGEPLISPSIIAIKHEKKRIPSNVKTQSKEIAMEILTRLNQIQEELFSGKIQFF